MDWVAGAIDETTQKGSAWNLFEDELLERLAAVMEKQHPKLCPPLAEQPSTEELLKPVFEAATAKLETVAAKTPSRHRSTFGQIARLIVNVDKARRKLRYLGERNLRAQINQNRVSSAASNMYQRQLQICPRALKTCPRGLKTRPRGLLAR